MVSGCAVHLPREVRSPTDPPHLDDAQKRPPQLRRGRAPCITPRAHPARSPGFLTTAPVGGPLFTGGLRSAAAARLCCALRRCAAPPTGHLGSPERRIGRSHARCGLRPERAPATASDAPRSAPPAQTQKKWGFASLRCSLSSRSRWYAARIPALEPERPVTGRQPPRPRRNSERSPPARRRATRFTSTA